MSTDSIKNSRGCPFCFDNIRLEIVDELNSMVVINDKNPVSEGHLLIIPKRHCLDYFDMTEEEFSDANNLLKKYRDVIVAKDPSVTGFNIGMNSGESAGQTIFHCHIHLIPRRDGDTENPRGGVRGVIPGMMNY